MATRFNPRTGESQWKDENGVWRDGLGPGGTNPRLITDSGTLGPSYMVGAGGGSGADTGMNSYNRDTYGALSAAPYTPPAPVIDNSFKGTDEEREAFLLDRARYAANAGTGVRYNSIPGIPGTVTTGQAPAPWVDDATELARARESRGGLYQLGLSFGGSAGSTNPLLSTPAYTQSSIMSTTAPAATAAAAPTPVRGSTFGGTQRAELPYWMKMR